MSRLAAMILFFLAVTGEATGPRAVVNIACGAASADAAESREARLNCSEVSVAAGFGVTPACGVRGNAAGIPLDEPMNTQRPGVTSPAAAMAVSAADRREEPRA